MNKSNFRHFTCKMLIVLAMLSLNASASTCGDTILLKGNWFSGFKYSYHCSDFNHITGIWDGKRTQEFKEILFQIPMAKKEFQKSETFKYWGLSIAVFGGALTGVNLGLLKTKQTNNFWDGYIGIGLACLGITFDIVGTHKFLNSVEIFNNWNPYLLHK